MNKFLKSNRPHSLRKAGKKLSQLRHGFSRHEINTADKFPPLCPLKASALMTSALADKAKPKKEKATLHPTASYPRMDRSIKSRPRR